MIEQPYNQIFDGLVKSYKPEYLPGLWNIAPGNDPIDNFARFTDGQGGGKSEDPADTASHNPPPKPDTDGHTYHTVRDVTWSTFCRVMAKNKMVATPERFYNMTDADKRLVVIDYLKVGDKTNSDLIDAFITYCAWGGSAFDYRDKNGHFHRGSVDNFTRVHGSLQDFIDAKGESLTFDIMMNDRILFLQKLNPKYAKGWTRGCLCFWKLFKS